ncbi:MAG TPA: hypothetical protein VMM14_03315 [Acidimicrobiia bacterium]|nr:hypothetical protein [Acidimicrobiia bacterium]
MKQNLFAGALSVWQLGQVRFSELPQLKQKEWSAAFSAPQFPQVTIFSLLNECV